MDPIVMETQFHKFLAALVLISIVVTRVSTSCQNKYVINRGLSCGDKDLILEMHNQLRQSIALGQVQGQPSASTMLLMSWDEELARKAQNLADTCHYGHDSNTARAVNRFYVGQNIATKWSTWEKNPKPDFQTQIKAWFNEVDVYSFSTVFRHSTGHYSQMVWGETYLIGCGYTYYFDGSRYHKIYVCNYGPAGNIEGQTPYYPGYPQCSSNGMISSDKYYGLCDSYRTYYPDYSCGRYRRGTGKANHLSIKDKVALKSNVKTKNSIPHKSSRHVSLTNQNINTMKKKSKMKNVTIKSPKH